MSEPAGDSALQPGTMVGAYRIEYRLGAGGMGTVYAAEEPTIKKRVAIKVMRHAFGEDTTAVARFEREARAANDVRHPGIVDVFAFGRLPDGRPYLVMSLLEGKSLRDEIAARGSLPASEAWAIAREIAAALAAAHERGIVHRDLKPDNVFLERFASGPPRVRVLDFGLAKVSQQPDESVAPMKLTQSGAPMGTPAYMAPEQWWNAEVDARTDQYAFGALLFEMLAGRPPFSSQQFVELVQQHLHQKPPSLADAGVDAPAAVEALVAKTLAKAAADRFPSMADLIATGDAAFAGAPSVRVSAGGGDALVHGVTLAVTPAIAPSSVESAIAAGPGGEAPRPLDPTGHARRFVAVLIGALALVAAALVGAGYAASSDGGARDVGYWIYIQGMSAFGVLFWLAVGLVAFVAVAARRARDGAPSRAVWILAVMPALGGGLSTYGGWHKVIENVGKAEPTQRFTLYNYGLFEANCGRFFGFAIAAVLFAALAVMAGVHRAWGTVAERSKITMGGAVALAALAVAAFAARAPSGALVAVTAFVVLAGGLALPIADGPAAAAREAERALAGAVALGLMVLVGLTRIEAREAILWDSQPTRASRVTEILDAFAERTPTVIVMAAAIGIAVAVEALRLRGRSLSLAAVRPRAGGWVLLAALIALATLDLLQHGAFRRTGDELRAAMAPQFSLFARLDPPTAEALDVERHPPHPAPALQIARDWIAVNGERVAKLAAVESQDGAANVGRDLSHGLAAAQPAEPAPGDPELSIAIDREVPWSSVERLLRIARSAGARRVEILFTRGAPPAIPPGAPPEAGYLLPKDFVALPASLEEDGFGAAADRRFADVAAELVRAGDGGQPVRLAAGGAR